MNIAAFDFEAHLARQAAFSALTFGPGARTEGICDHIRKELVEVAAAPGDLKEWIDVAILALDGAWRCGATPAQIIEALVAKQIRNEGRAWPDWRTADPAKAIEHDRSGESKQVQEPLALLTLGGIDGDEYGDNDLEVVSSKALEELQERLVHGQDPVVLELFAVHIAAAQVQPVAVPDGWCQFIDGVKTQNVARDVKELDTIKSIFKVMAPVGAKAEYRPFYFATPAAQGDATQAAIDVLAERRRQVDGEGMTNDADDRPTKELQP